MVIWHMFKDKYSGWQGPEDKTPKTVESPKVDESQIRFRLYTFKDNLEQSRFTMELGRLAAMAKEESGYAHDYGLGHPIDLDTLESEYSRRQRLALDVVGKWAGLDKSFQERAGRNYLEFIVWNSVLMGQYKQELQRRAR